MALSDLTVRQAKTTGKRYTLSDNDCLGLMVSAAGGKSWQFRYYWLGKQSACAWVAILPSACARPGPSGTRPRPCSPGDRSPGRARPETARGQAGGRIHLQDRLRCLGRASPQGTQGRPSEHAFPDPAHLQQGRAAHSGKDVDLRHSSPQLLGVLAAIEKRKAFTTAEKVRTWFNQMFRYALVIAEGLEVNPAADLDVVAEPAPGGPQPLPAPARDARVPSEAPALQPRGWQTQLGVRLLFLTGVRTGELRLAEPEQFDLDRGLWIIPPQIVKQLQDEMRKAGKRPQDVPLYRAAVPAGHRDRPLPPGRNAAGAKIPAVAP